MSKSTKEVVKNFMRPAEMLAQMVLEIDTIPVNKQGTYQALMQKTARLIGPANDTIIEIVEVLENPLGL